ncbi:hypothetical protein HMPREF9564_00361 [Cutibacterium acnes HL053PA1]|nr:hypothetical protein HMPREF9574_02374 [Cutibacterium acnes HL074PA1]EFT19494.1 hypothetical protein HMPREF9564_00361 [Cutibacterium acnes HL053PA1]
MWPIWWPTGPTRHDGSRHALQGPGGRVGLAAWLIWWLNSPGSPSGGVGIMCRGFTGTSMMAMTGG